MEEKSERELGLEKRINELENELKRTKAELDELKWALEYQYRTEEKTRPQKPITLKEYLEGLYNNSTRKDMLGKNFIISEAKLEEFGFRRDWLAFGSYFLYTVLSDENGNKALFKYYCPKKYQSVLNEILGPLSSSSITAIVTSTSKRYHFIKGIVKEGKEILF